MQIEVEGPNDVKSIFAKSPENTLAPDPEKNILTVKLNMNLQIFTQNRRFY
jgi:hypothetical protein